MADTQTGDNTPLKIKKYSNRRFYDATRSCHVTLVQMHELIRDGFELQIVDGKTGEDITNLVLTQIILERDAPKLGIFPSAVLHDMIRTQQEYLGNVVEQFFAQVLETHTKSQAQWTRFLQNTLGMASAGMANPANPLDWTRSFMGAFTPGAGAPPASSNSDAKRDAEIQALRDQVATLTKLLERIAGEKN